MLQANVTLYLMGVQTPAKDIVSSAFAALFLPGTLSDIIILWLPYLCLIFICSLMAVDASRKDVWKYTC